MKNERPPHKWVAEKIGFSIAGVSLLRNGVRSPSFETMEVIERALGWSMARQMRARGRKNYAAEFERILVTQYAKEKREQNSA